MTEMADLMSKYEKKGKVKYLLAALDVFHFESVHYSSYNGKNPIWVLIGCLSPRRMIAAKMYDSKIKMALKCGGFFCRCDGL